MLSSKFTPDHEPRIMPDPILPFWFKQRQATLTPAGADVYKVTAPNAVEAFIGIRQVESQMWSAFLSQAADGAPVAVTEPIFAEAAMAWEAAFELYRGSMIY